MKDLLIGAFTDYDLRTIKPWVDSAEETITKDVDKVLIVGRTTQETIDYLKERNWQLVSMSEGQPHVIRFLDIYNYLRMNPSYGYVVTTDVRDVVFQSNPFNQLREDLGTFGSGEEIICGSECLRYCDEPWGNQNLLETYGEYVWNIYKHETIYNVGVLGGTAEFIKDLVFNIVINAVNRPIPICDQAVFNMLINTQPYKDVVFKADMTNAWACHAGTVADPSKMSQFRPNLLEPEPVWKDGKVYTWNDALITILHQYDRVPEWKKAIEARYNV